ncbi:hypothetical protein PEL8287_01152 [Roseovarius litorisediminis]|uniref:Uncharacterized protein n=1 Tax=Roseovarius litorisediminis TaxID=1312363 RepID=A0A1Y5RTM1_9RHOB|nr:hypothetical protein [Roseovarius litorisediminis]SLN25303.1 hypothetical protein PEL8287_01152 [Roseovarius litorisediminis]
MTDIKTALETHVSDRDWEMMAKHAGMPAAEVKKKVLNGIANSLGADGTAELTTVSSAPVLSDLALAPRTVADDCATQDFEVSLFKIIGIKGSLKVCGTNTSNWTAELKVCLIVAGASVWCTTYHFDPHNLSVCFSPTVGVAKADLCFTVSIHSNKICLSIKGKACVWGLGWHCGKFNEQLFCIPI